MGGLDGIEEADQHVRHALEQHRQPVEHLAAAQFLGVVDHHFDAQDAAALGVDFQCQVAPLDLEDRQIVALRLHCIEHLGPVASPLCRVMRAMRKPKIVLTCLSASGTRLRSMSFWYTSSIVVPRRNSRLRLNSSWNTEY